MGSVAPVVVVANPTAGRGKARRRIGSVDSMLRERGIAHEVRVAGSAQAMEATCREVAERGAEIIAVIGGDGTVSCAVNGLVGTGAALAVLPAGTGDDFAAAIGATPLRTAVRLLASPRLAAIDVVRVRTAGATRSFVNVAGAGFDSAVNETANTMTLRLGATGSYVAALVKTLSKFTPARYEIAVDGSATSVEAMLVVVGNGSSYGGGMKVLPQASIADGRIDICIVEALSKTAFLRAFPSVYRGRHTAHPKVRMLRGTSVTVESDREMQVYADGEHIGPLPARFDVTPAALQVVVGPSATGMR